MQGFQEATTQLKDLVEASWLYRRPPKKGLYGIINTS
jgi:hypothetical protein